MGKTWLERGFLDRRKSTGIDYPPKRKKIWQNDGFMEMEHFHEGGYRPFDTVIPPRILRGSVPDNLREGPRGPQFGCCSGIDLPTVTECDDEWLLGHIQDNYLAIELRATVPGNAVFWSVVGYGTSSGSVIGGPAISDGKNCPVSSALYLVALPFTGVLDHIVMKDNTGCEDEVIISLGEECGSEIGGCEVCDCEDTEAGCYGECCGWTESGTQQATTQGDTKTFTCSGGGDWSVAGAGLNGTTISGGVLSVSGTACGTIEVINSVCGSRFVAVTDSGKWAFGSDISYTVDMHTIAGCTSVAGGDCWAYSYVSQTHYWWGSACACSGDSSVERAGHPSCGPGIPDLSCSGGECNPEDPPLGSCIQFNYISRAFVNIWVCP